MSLQCPFCRADLPSTARMCQSCSLDIGTWLQSHPDRTLPGWTGPPPREAPPERANAGGGAPVDHVKQHMRSARWEGAGVLFFFAVVNFLIGRFAADWIAGDAD